MKDKIFALGFYEGGINYKKRGCEGTIKIKIKKR